MSFQLNPSKYLNRTLKGVVSVGLLAVLIGCSSAPKIHALYEEKQDFSKYSTFSFADKLNPKGEEGYTSLVDKHLKAAIKQELQARGITEADGTGAGDLMVNYHLSEREKIRASSGPSVNFGYGSFGSRSGVGYGIGYGTRSDVTQYTEGRLVIDLVDRAQKQMVWQGAAIDRLKELNPETMEADIAAVVKLIFEKYPAAQTDATTQ